MKVFLDTNVVVDFCALREPHYDSIASVMELARRKDISIVISSLTFVNLAYILRKAFVQEIVYTKLIGLSGLCEISRVDDSVVREAIESKRKDFEDSVQYFSALTSNADVILTRDKTGFEGLPTLAMTAEEFIQRCS